MEQGIPESRRAAAKSVRKRVHLVLVPTAQIGVLSAFTMSAGMAVVTVGVSLAVVIGKQRLVAFLTRRSVSESWALCCWPALDFSCSVPGWPACCVEKLKPSGALVDGQPEQLLQAAPISRIGPSRQIWAVGELFVSFEQTGGEGHAGSTTALAAVGAWQQLK